MSSKPRIDQSPCCTALVRPSRRRETTSPSTAVTRLVSVASSIARRQRRSLSAHVVEEMEPGESLDEGPRHLARPAGPDHAGQELLGFVLGEPGEVLVPGVGPAPLLRRVAWQVARVDLQDQPALGGETIGPVLPG